MRYTESENPYIWCRFTTGDSVTITIYKSSDSSVIVNAVSMSELVSTGYFKYQFNPSPTELTEYFYIATNTIEEHAGKIILGGYPDNTENIADQVWDEVLTGATHNISTSAGRRVREIGAFAIHSGTAQAGNSHCITLASTASSEDGVYNRNLIVLVDDTGAGQTRTIIDYDGTTKIAIVDRDWRISPDATTSYQITPYDTPLIVDHGIAQGGSADTITIREYASSTNDTYLCNIVSIVAGTGRGQARLVGSYNGTSKVITICGENWAVNPDSTSVYIMMPYGTACISCVNDSALSQIKTKMEEEGSNLDFIKNIEGGKWHITGNQMIFTKSDNVTEICRFNLFDSLGNPAETNVFRRDRV